MVPVLSSSSELTSPAASTALPLSASTLCCMTRSMPAMPIADKSPPMVVGIRQTSRETRTATVGTRSRSRLPDAEDRVRMQRNNGEQEYQGQAGDQDVQGNLVGRLLPFRSLDQGDHAIQKGLAGIRRDADLDLVREHLGAAGHGAAIAARFANDRRAFAGDHGFIDGCNALRSLRRLRESDPRRRRAPHRPARSAELGTCSISPLAIRRFAERVRPGLSERIRLGLPARFRHRLRRNWRTAP